MGHVFCFSCGAQTGSIGQQAVPICADCRSRGVGSTSDGAQWMIRAGENPPRGPLTKTAVLHWLGKEKIGPDDRVSMMGGDYLALADHPEFRGCFIPGSADELKLQGFKAQHAKSRRRAFVGRLVQRATLAVLVLFAGSLLWIGANTRILVLPPSALSFIEASFEVVKSYWKPTVSDQPDFTAPSIPHSDWVEAQRIESEDSELDLHTARQGIWTAEMGELDQVRRTMLRAMGRSPRDPMPLVGLIEVDSELLGTHPELLGEIVRANSRLEALNGSGMVVDRARAAFALAKGDNAGARVLTKDCLNNDVGCALIFAEASQSIDALSDIRGQLGPIARVLRAMGRTALASKDWTALNSVASEMISVMPNEATGYLLRSEQMAALGDWRGASTAAHRAFELNPDLVGAAHMEAAYLFDIEGNFRKSALLFQSLLEHHLIEGYPRKETLRVQAIMSTLGSGDSRAARVIANAALAASPNHPGIQLAEAFVLKSEGKGAEAETALRTIGTNGLQGREAAEIHLWTARLYIDLGKQRLARGELEDAERQEPNWKPVVEETIWALLTTKDITGAISMVQTLPLLASEPQAPTDPREVIGLGAPSTRPISQELLLSMDDDIRYGKDRDAISSLLGWMYRPSSESVSFLQEVAERDAGRLAVQAALAQAYHQDQDWVLAHKYAQNVVSRQPSNALFQLLRGHALTKLDRWADAEDALNRAIRLGVEDARILQLAAECFKARGDKTRAKELLEQAAVADSANTSVRRSLLALDSRNE